MAATKELFFRTEDIAPGDISQLFVETRADRLVVDACKSKASVVVQGSRGVGKSFLLRVAQSELDDSFATEKCLPVYVTFNKAGLLQSRDPLQFQHWMMAKLCNRILRAARQKGLIERSTSILSALSHGSNMAGFEARLERVEAAFENSWRNPNEMVSSDIELDPQLIKDAVEDLCAETGLRRIVLLVDEAAHVFIPDQQRQFFTLMRDLRSPQISVKAAVYPGVTAFGDSFQMSHDASLFSVDRDILDDGYLDAMQEIVLKQDPALASQLRRNGEAFAALAFAATGNPRILLKTLSRASSFNSTNAARAIREYYREMIWAEHSALGERYTGHRELIDWGRDFIESHVIPELYERNQQDRTQAYVSLWIHRDAPAPVVEALRLLCYSGILQEAGSGLRATRGGTGNRYIVNIGCSIVQDGEPIQYCTRVRQLASIKRMQEYGANHAVYRQIATVDVSSLAEAQNRLLEEQLRRPSEELDLTAWQRKILTDHGFDTVGKVLAASEADFQSVKWVGPTRSRQMMNAATSAVLEYLSG